MKVVNIERRYFERINGVNLHTWSWPNFSCTKFPIYIDIVIEFHLNK